MERMTITEALSEIKLIEKKVEKKKEAIISAVSRIEHLADPYAPYGGSQEFCKRENQAIHDLWGRLIKFREAIAKANIEQTITVEGITKTISQWLAWKREVQEQSLSYFQEIKNNISTVMRQVETQPKFYKTESGEPSMVKVVFNVELSDINKQIENIVTIKEKLDGQLSLKNATVVVAID